MIAASGRRLIYGTVFLLLLPVYAHRSFGLILITSDPAQVAAFQAGATVETFDDLSALAITSYASGQTVPAGNQFSSRDLAAFTAPFFNSGGASFNDPISNPGTRIGIFNPEDGIAGDVVSQNNVAGPLAGGTDQAFGNGFMEVIFPADVIRVGFWVTHGTFTMFLKDSNNSNLTTGDFSVNGNAGQFIGIQRDTADIRGITMGFPESFTLDDLTYATTAIVVPEPASILLAAMSLATLVCFRKRARRPVKRVTHHPAAGVRTQ